MKYIKFTGSYAALKELGYECINHDGISYWKNRNCIQKKGGEIFGGKNRMAFGEPLFELLKSGAELILCERRKKVFFYYNDDLDKITLDKSFVSVEGKKTAMSLDASLMKKLEAKGSDMGLVFAMTGEKQWEPTYVDSDFIDDIKMFINKGWATLAEI